MTRISMVGFAASVWGCGPSESAFVVDYTDAYCAWYLECADPAQQVFDGLDTIEECQSVYGPGVADRAATCKIDRAAAKHCLDAMARLTCPEEEGAVLDDGLPSECATAWKKCLGQPEEDTGDEP